MCSSGLPRMFVCLFRIEMTWPNSVIALKHQFYMLVMKNIVRATHKQHQCLCTDYTITMWGRKEATNAVLFLFLLCLFFLEVSPLPPPPFIYICCCFFKRQSNR